MLKLHLQFYRQKDRKERSGDSPVPYEVAAAPAIYSTAAFVYKNSVLTIESPWCLFPCPLLSPVTDGQMIETGHLIFLTLKISLKYCHLNIIVVQPCSGIIMKILI